MEEVEFTEEELAQLEGKDVEDEDPPHQPDEEEVAEEPTFEPVPESEAAPDELEKQKRANAGLLNELIRVRRQEKEQREWREQVERRMDMLSAKDEQEEEPQESLEPDRDEDPVAWLAWDQERKIAVAMEPVKLKEAQEEQAKQYAEVVKRAGEAAVLAEKEFIENSEISDEVYKESLDELRFDRLKWYYAEGRSPDDAMQIVQEEERQFVINCLRNEVNPAAEIMRLHSVVSPGKIPVSHPSAPVAAPTEKATQVVQKIVTARKGVKEGGLQNIGESAGSGTITAEQLAEMDVDDPIYQKIAGNERLWAAINIQGKVTL